MRTVFQRDILIDSRFRRTCDTASRYAVELPGDVRNIRSVTATGARFFGPTGEPAVTLPVDVGWYISEANRGGVQISDDGTSWRAVDPGIHRFKECRKNTGDSLSSPEGVKSVGFTWGELRPCSEPPPSEIIQTKCFGDDVFRKVKYGGDRLFRFDRTTGYPETMERKVPLGYRVLHVPQFRADIVSNAPTLASAMAVFPTKDASTEGGTGTLRTTYRCNPPIPSLPSFVVEWKDPWGRDLEGVPEHILRFSLECVEPRVPTGRLRY